MHLQDEVLRQSLQEPDAFWSRQAQRLHWHKKPDAALRTFDTTTMLTDGTKAHHRSWEWFPGGELSTCYNCVDRHVLAGRGDSVAIYYDSPVTGTKEQFTYQRLLDEVRVLAGALCQEGVKKGDVVMLYMPMIPAAIIGILAINRLGAVHSVVFGGFAGPALAQRIDACKPVVLLTASCGIDGNKPPIAYRPLVEEALGLATHPPRRTVIWQREELRWGRTDRLRQSSWQKWVRSAASRGHTADCVAVGSSDPVYVIHTSGTTGTPKGVRRDAGGHAVGIALSAGYFLGAARGPGDVVCTASDVGWVVGHSFIVYAPLLAGAATVLYEGKPVGTPDAAALWRLAEEYRVTALFTAPTALRAVRRDDPDGKLMARIGDGGGLRCLRALFLAGERSEPGLVSAYQQMLGRYAAPGAQVVDNWWSTESGSPITGRALAPDAAGVSVSHGAELSSSLPEMRPGSAGKAMPGFDVRVVDDEGREVSRGAMGNIVLGLPLAPTAFRTLWGEEERFYRSYLARFGGRWLDTGDAGIMDEEGYVHVMSRNDDVLNVSAHRLSSGAIEQAISTHPLVAECCVVGIPDALKGQLPLAFVTLSSSSSEKMTEEKVTAEVQAAVRRQVGGIATLGGVVVGPAGMIPKTRSGKTLRRVLRELAERAARGEGGDVVVPSTIEDVGAVEVARGRVKDFFERRGVKAKL